MSTYWDEYIRQRDAKREARRMKPKPQPTPKAPKRKRERFQSYTSYPAGVQPAQWQPSGADPSIPPFEAD